MEHPVSEFKSKGGLKRIINALGYSLDGLAAAWRHENAFRQEVVAFGVLTVVALVLPISVYQKLFLIAVLVFVLIVELINSAIEAAVDRVSLERHPLAKNAKDLGSAAVMLAMFLAGMSWAVVLFARFY
jgi:diacylglycerol kinase (ATP)